MHSKAGRPIREGDQVITKDYNGRTVAGYAHNCRAGETCNLDVAIVKPGGVEYLTCRTAGELYHVDDGLALLEEKFNQPKVAQPSKEAITEG